MSFGMDLSTYRGRTIYPNKGGLLGVGQFPINKDAQLQIEQQGGAGHEREYGVQANLKGIQLWMDTSKQDEMSIMNALMCGLCHGIINRSSDPAWQGSLSCYRRRLLDKERKPAGHSRLIMSIANGGSCKQAGSMVLLRLSNSSMVSSRSRKGSDWSRRMSRAECVCSSGCVKSLGGH